MTNRTKSKFTSHCRIAAKTNFLMLFFLARFAHARYSSRMIDRFLNWGDHGKPKSGKIKGRCQPPCLRLTEESYCNVKLKCPDTGQHTVQILAAGIWNRMSIFCSDHSLFANSVSSQNIASGVLGTMPHTPALNFLGVLPPGCCGYRPGLNYQLYGQVEKYNVLERKGEYRRLRCVSSKKKKIIHVVQFL